LPEDYLLLQKSKLPKDKAPVWLLMGANALFCLFFSF
jgi:hypothetical protein